MYFFATHKWQHESFFPLHRNKMGTKESNIRRKALHISRFFLKLKLANLRFPRMIQQHPVRQYSNSPLSCSGWWWFIKKLNYPELNLYPNFKATQIAHWGQRPYARCLKPSSRLRILLDSAQGTRNKGTRNNEREMLNWQQAQITAPRDISDCGHCETALKPLTR